MFTLKGVLCTSRETNFSLGRCDLELNNIPVDHKLHIPHTKYLSYVWYHLLELKSKISKPKG